MKNKLIALLATGLLAACGAGSNSTDTTADTAAKAQTRQLTRSTKAAASDYQNAVQSLYIAYFGRPADPNGLANFEASLLADGAPTTVSGIYAAYSTNAAVKTLVDSFGTSTESKNLYPNADATTFVQAVFQHVLGRAAATDGLNFWVNAVNTGSVTQGNAALAIMAGAETNTTAQGVIDAQLIASRITAAQYFTTQVQAQLVTSSYTGATAANLARTMLAKVITGTDLTAFQAQENTTIAGLPNRPTVGGNVGAYTGTNLVTFDSAGDASLYDAAGNQYGLDASTYQIMSLANNTYLTGLTVYPSNGDWYLMSGGSIIGYLGYVTGPKGASVIGMYLTTNAQNGVAEINLSASGYTVGCTAACTGNSGGSAQPTALQEIDNAVGTGAVAAFGHTVTVNYTGWLYSTTAANNEGTLFDSSAAHGGTYSFPLGAGEVIAGWDMGVIGMKVGGTRTLIIPPSLGYGSTANGSIPANSTLVFSVQLVSVQ